MLWLPSPKTLLRLLTPSGGGRNAEKRSSGDSVLARVSEVAPSGTAWLLDLDLIARWSDRVCGHRWHSARRAPPYPAWGLMTLTAAVKCKFKPECPTPHSRSVMQTGGFPVIAARLRRLVAPGAAQDHGRGAAC